MNCPSSSSSSSSSSPTSSSSYSPRNRENMVLQSVVDVSTPSFSSDRKSVRSQNHLHLFPQTANFLDNDFSFTVLPIQKTLINQQNSNIPKSSEELKKEIATIELEILHMEQYLLSLYRRSFEQQLPSFSNLSVTTSPSLTLSNHYQPISYPRSFNTSLKALSSRVVSGNQSLGELLRSSDYNNLINPNKLSEDIIRCISSVYCTLSRSSTRTNFTCFPASPLSSLSSSSTVFSSKSKYNDKWSLDCASEDHCMNQSQDQGNVPCGGVVIEGLRLHLDDGSFGYAALLLQNFRSMVKDLEKVDPSRMKREEKLAFWINIHNALVMHAYLAYGTHNRARNTSVLKAAYDVGGYRINPFIIQSSILGIRPHHSSPSHSLQTLFSPSRKSKSCSVRHIYALEYPEALAHFAISSGAFTDPTVRVYTADRIFRDLRRAKQEFIRSHVRVHKGTKILLPKIFQYYAKDMSIDVTKLMEVTAECLPKDARKIAEKCLKEKTSKNIEWLPENLSFRYVIAGELVGGGNKM